MFDITSSKLLLLGIVALLVIGPKDFPALLRTIGKYVGMIRGHAREFRAQFDEAMRESELADLKKDVENIARETEASMQATGQTVENSLAEARQSMDASLDTGWKPPPDAVASDPPAADALAPDPLAPDPLAPDPLAHDANGLPLAPPQPAPAIEADRLNGAHAGEPPVHAPAETTTPTTVEPAPEQGRPAEKSGA